MTIKDHFVILRNKVTKNLGVMQSSPHERSNEKSQVKGLLLDRKGEPSRLLSVWKKEEDIEVKFFFKYGVLLVGVLWLMAPEVFAFSIGELQVKSKFGEKFSASFDIHLDFEGPVELGLGDAQAYKKLGFARQDIIDALVVSSVTPGEGLRKTVQIHSNNPLFFPSFNLVVWATHNGGTLLENFLVTVDFQQSLALNVRGKKEKTAEKLVSKPLVGQEKVPSEIQALTTEESSDKKAPRIPRNPPDASHKEPEVLPTAAIVPVAAKAQVLHRRRLSGVIWAHPRPFPDLTTGVAKTQTAPSIETSALVEKSGAETGLPPSEGGYVLKKGEGLFSIARKLKVGNYHPAQIAVAIWMRNIDKFIFGNINGIRQGVQLNLENLEDSISAIDLHTARGILKSQTAEWDLTKKAASVKAETEEKPIPEIPLPVERLKGLADIFAQVNGWQTTWENMDTEGHLAYYQLLENENPFLARKKRFLARHPKKNRLVTSTKILMLKEGTPLVFFKQAFSSATLKSQGLKELEWTRTASGWKIRGEYFYKLRSVREPLANPTDKSIAVGADESIAVGADESIAVGADKSIAVGADKSIAVEKTIKLSFVIHVSSHADESAAVFLVNRLRKNGFDAYWVPVRISKETRIYRVYVGRFSEWSQAHRVVRILRKKPFGGHATAIPYPFALQVGEADSLVEAKVLLESLRKSGLSGLLLVSYDERTHFRVVVGAFKKAANATWMLQQLKQSGFIGKLVSP